VGEASVELNGGRIDQQIYSLPPFPTGLLTLVNERLMRSNLQKLGQVALENAVIIVVHSTGRIARMIEELQILPILEFMTLGGLS
jgi:hypothetical protein